MCGYRAYFTRAGHALARAAASITLAACLLGGTEISIAGTIAGIGTRRCADYLAAVDKHQKPAIDAYISWAQGFISAHNWLDAQGRDVSIDPDGLTYWLVDYCGTERSATFYGAVQALIGRHAR
jgi:hypothetical protein